MISRWKRDKQPTARLLSTRAITLVAVVVLGIGAAAFTLLWWRYGGAGRRLELDAIRTAGALMVAAGGAATLLLAARRQVHAERDASEQRITELYTRAVDQLGVEKAPVRLGGLHALERLAQNNPAQRQTIVDVICAYLRMPYIPPDDQAPAEDAPEDVHRRYEQRRQELQVRLTAQRILTAHLEPEAAAVFWDGIDLNLTEAHLSQFDLAACHVRRAQFAGATFAGDAGFVGVTFAGDAGFRGVTFAGNARFRGVTFAGNSWFSKAKFGGAEFDEVKFTGTAVFSGAEFAGTAKFGETAEFGYAKFGWDAVFRGAKFAGEAGFCGAEFARHAVFARADFAGRADFHEAVFIGSAWFREAVFTGDAEFGTAQFTAVTKFDGARVALRSRLVLLPTGWITRAAQPVEGEEEGWLYVVRDEDSSEQPTESPGGGEVGAVAKLEHEA